MEDRKTDKWPKTTIYTNGVELPNKRKRAWRGNRQKLLKVIKVVATGAFEAALLSNAGVEDLH